MLNIQIKPKFKRSIKSVYDYISLFFGINSADEFYSEVNIFLKKLYKNSEMGIKIEGYPNMHRVYFKENRIIYRLSEDKIEVLDFISRNKLKSPKFYKKHK